MEGARGPIPEFRQYWIRYFVVFWGGEHLRWVRDNILVACICSLAPGLIAAGVSAVLSDDKWRAAAHATLLTYTGLFVAFLSWRVVATPLELDRERQRSINELVESLADTNCKLNAFEAGLPVIDAEILEIDIQVDSAYAPHAPASPLDCDIFLRVTLNLLQIRPIEALEYELGVVLNGNTRRADFVDDAQDWGLVTSKKPAGVGRTFYTVSRLSKLTHRLKRAGVPVEGWLHFRVYGVNEYEIGASVYRLNVLTPTGAVSTEIPGMRNSATLRGTEFQKIPIASSNAGSVGY